MINDPLIVAEVTAIASVIVSIFGSAVSTYLISKKDKDLKKLEIKEAREVRIGVLFSKAFEAIGSYGIDEYSKEKFCENVFPIIPYVSKETADNIFNLYNQLLNDNREDLACVPQIMELIRTDYQLHMEKLSLTLPKRILRRLHKALRNRC